jgi:hypothetical protein
MVPARGQPLGISNSGRVLVSDIVTSSWVTASVPNRRASPPEASGPFREPTAAAPALTGHQN